MSLHHPTAVIEPGADLGNEVSVGPFAYIRSGARIGDGCTIGPHVTVFGQVTLGPGCRVHAGAVLGDVPQDLGFEGGDSTVEIGRNCIIRECVTIQRGTKDGSKTVLGDNCFLMAYSHCAHNVELGDGVILVTAAVLGGYVRVASQAFISGQVAVHQFVNIGRLAMLGGGAIVTKDVPPFCTMRDAEMNVVVGLNVVGMRRAGLTADDRLGVKRAYAALYSPGVGLRDSARAILAGGATGPAAEMAEFVLAAKRGVCVPSRRQPRGGEKGISSEGAASTPE